jgi:hypothetical protein
MCFYVEQLPVISHWELLLGRSDAKEKSDTAGIVNIDLVFARNETYHPAPLMPVIFSHKNTKPILLFSLWIKDMEIQQHKRNQYQRIDGYCVGELL